MIRGGLLKPGLFVALGLMLASGAMTVARAEDYVLGSEDVIQISVYLHPELERTAAISADGDITFPPIGQIKAAGSTPKQLGDRIADKLSSYLRQTTAVTVTVTQYLSRSVFVQGAVARPGRYGFERIPSLIDVIGQAGGALPGADLSRVEIVHREGDRRTTQYADVGAALRDGVGVPLPALRPGDTVTIPAGLSSGAGGVPTGGEGVGVLGEVARPGVYPVGGASDLWNVLALAGGLTPRGDLSSVRVITRDAGTQAVVTVNLKEALTRGTHGPYTVKAGDVVFVTPSGVSQFGRAWNGFTQLLTVSTQVLQLVVLKDIERNR